MIETTQPAPSVDECEQIWSAAVAAYHAASPPMSKNWTPTETTRMRVQAGLAAWQKVHELERIVANARLIAAAPELYEALKALTPPMPQKDSMCHRGFCSQEACGNCQRIAAAHAALGKAEGRP